MRPLGGVPERPKGTGCKPVGSAYGGSNPPAPTSFLPACSRVALAAPIGSALVPLGRRTSLGRAQRPAPHKERAGNAASYDRAVERFDAIVVGAGPAGSLAAYRLARAGARVVLLDRARFPRDKPCGGGLTVRAVRELPFAVDSVIEDAATRFRLRAHYRGGFERCSREPLVALTQRRRLDAYLAERAAAAGADFRDGQKVEEVSADARAVSVRVGGRRIEAAALVGADGTNGVVARSLGLSLELDHGVALEGNVAHTDAPRARYAHTIALEFGAVPGGYGWVFPKGDHVNVGVGGWASEGPRLREHLRRLCEAHRLPTERVRSLRGHRLPLRRPEARLARGRALVIGDAAGLVDPFSGDGIYEAFLSARLGADAVTSILAGERDTVEPYEQRLRSALGRLPAFSWGLKAAIDRFPRAGLAAVRLPPAWPVIEAVVRGELDDISGARGAARPVSLALGWLARRAGDPGRSFRFA